MRKIVILVWFTFCAISLSIQHIVADSPKILGSLPQANGVYPDAVEALCSPRADFFSYSNSLTAQKGDMDSEFFYKPVVNFDSLRTDSSTIYTASVELSARWMGRATRLHTEGSRRAHRVWINGNYIGSATDSRLPSEFLVSTNLVTGNNDIKIEVLDRSDPVSNLSDNRLPLSDVYLVSQPMAHIANYEVVDRVDSLGKGHLMVTITIENGYNSKHPISAGCVVTLPDGRTNGYIPIEKNVKESATEQFTFDVEIEKPLFWSPDLPNLYPILLYVRFDGQITEYVPIKAAFRQTEITTDIIAKTFNALATQQETTTQLKELKQQGITRIMTDYPQPSWFYDVCDLLGVEVIESVNIYANSAVSDNSIFVKEFEHRAETTFERSNQHPCIVGYRVANVENRIDYALWKALLKLEKLRIENF